jgi:hypothetical protein
MMKYEGRTVRKLKGGKVGRSEGQRKLISSCRGWKAG